MLNPVGLGLRRVDWGCSSILYNRIVVEAFCRVSLQRENASRNGTC